MQGQGSKWVTVAVGRGECELEGHLGRCLQMERWPLRQAQAGTSLDKTGWAGGGGLWGGPVLQAGCPWPKRAP